MRLHAPFRGLRERVYARIADYAMGTTDEWEEANLFRNTSESDLVGPDQALILVVIAHQGATQRRWSSKRSRRGRVLSFV